MSDPELRILDEFLVELSLPDKLISVRKSSRAKRLIFKSSLFKGVEIVIPVKAKISWVKEMIQVKVPWIIKTIEHLKSGRTQLSPNKIDLLAIDEKWEVNYVDRGNIKSGLMQIGHNSLLVESDSIDIFHSARKLQTWFHQKSRDILVPWLCSIAKSRKLTFNRVYIKNQTSLWGSCSRKRNINLNRNLMFMQDYLVEYVLHHELTHLDHMDHSKNFWTAFEQILPDCLELKREIGLHKPESIPLWASPGLKQL